MAIFMWQLFWAKGCSDSTLFLRVSVRVVPDGLSIWIGLNKADCTPPCGWASSNPLRAWIEKGRGRKDSPQLASCLPACLPAELRGSSPALGRAELTPSLAPRFSGLWTQTGIAPPVLLGLHLADSRSWDSSASITREPISHNKSLHSYLFPPLWRALANTSPCYHTAHISPIAFPLLPGTPGTRTAAIMEHSLCPHARSRTLHTIVFNPHNLSKVRNLEPGKFSCPNITQLVSGRWYSNWLQILCSPSTLTGALLLFSPFHICDLSSLS